MLDPCTLRALSGAPQIDLADAGDRPMLKHFGKSYRPAAMWRSQASRP